MPVNGLCPNCRATLEQPYACASCDWRAPARTFELTPGVPVKTMRNMTPVEREQARAIAAPHIARIKTILAKPYPQGHILAAARGRLSRLALAGIDQDPEAIAERDAIKRELKA